MKKSELIQKITVQQASLPPHDVALCVKSILTCLMRALNQKRRIEIRDFGNLSVRYQAPRESHNPKTNQKINVPGKYKVHFKMGKGLKERLEPQFDMNTI